MLLLELVAVCIPISVLINVAGAINYLIILIILQLYVKAEVDGPLYQLVYEPSQLVLFIGNFGFLS